MLQAFTSSVAKGLSHTSRHGSSLARAAAGILQHSQLLHSTVTRDPAYSKHNEDDVEFFQSALGGRGVVEDAAALEPMNRDWMGKYQGSSKLALRPSTTDEVSQLLAYCSLRRLAVVPQAGNTGLVGGSVPVFDEIVLNMGNMNKIISFDEVSGVLVAQSGCILQTLDEYVQERGYIMPLDLGSKGSCQIGGNVSTNAGGLRLLRYGSLHGSVLGLEVVLPDGTVLDLLKQLRKDNTGYDLKQLFIGSEGCLGVITAVAIQCAAKPSLVQVAVPQCPNTPLHPNRMLYAVRLLTGVITAVAIQCAPKPSSVQVAFLQCPSFAAVQQVLSTAKRQLGEILSAVEFLDAGSLSLATSLLPGVSNPLGNTGAAAAAAEGVAVSVAAGSPMYMVVETQGSSEQHDKEKLEAFLEAVMSQGSVDNGTLAESQAQAAAIWRVREGVTEALQRRGATYKYDLSMPTHKMYELVEAVRQRVQDFPDVMVVGYGHVGDGNLHLNVSSPDGYNSELEDVLEPYVYEWTAQQGGSISAEHGIGRMKAAALQYSKSSEAVDVMQRLKLLFDPHRILNPYKVLPDARHLGEVERY